MNTYIKEMEKCILNGFNDNYDIQWGDESWFQPAMYGPRYECPQPIVNCDNNGKNMRLM